RVLIDAAGDQSPVTGSKSSALSNIACSQSLRPSFPAATSTLSFGNRTAICPTRPTLIAPADRHVPGVTAAAGPTTVTRSENKKTTQIENPRDIWRPAFTAWPQ